MHWRQELQRQQAARRDQHLWRHYQPLDSPQSAEVRSQGKTFLNFCSNDYLGLANHPKLRQAAHHAIDQWGCGAAAAHLVCGHMTPHQDLEHRLADFVGAERALLFSTGYMANLGVPQSLLQRGDLLIEDRLNHASLIDAAHLCRATLRRYPHRDHQRAAQLLTTSQAPRKPLSTDALFSMDGDRAPIAHLNAATQKSHALLLLDDAHGFGVLGPCGAGSYAEQNLTPSGHRLLLATLGKAAGGFGAFVAGDALYIDQLRQHARPYLYTTAPPPALAATALAALKLIATESWRRDKLHESIHYFRTQAAKRGLKLLPSETPIQPLLLGTAARALQASRQLADQGIWVTAIRPPTVPPNTARLRIPLTTAHTQPHLNHLLTALPQLNQTPQ